MSDVSFDILKTALEKAISNPVWMNNFDSDFANKAEKSIKAVTPVISGALKNSVKVTPLKSGINVSMLYYGIYVDEGTKRMKARHFIARGLGINIGPMIAQEIEKTLKEALQ